MKLLFVFAHEYPEKWKDGLNAALKVLEGDFEIEYLNLALEQKPLPECDFALGWGAFGSPADKYLRNQEVKKGLCIGGMAHYEDTLTNPMNYDILFYETEFFKPMISKHPNIKRAFGVNTDIFHNTDSERTIDVLGVGAFANWKRHHEILEVPGDVRLVIGEIQSGGDGQDPSKGGLAESMNIIGYLLTNGVGVLPMIPPEKLAEFYNRSKLVFLPAHLAGGGERAVWEARLCGCDVQVAQDNPKLKELLYGEVLDHFAYAESLREGILGCQ